VGNFQNGVRISTGRWHQENVDGVGPRYGRSLPQADRGGSGGTRTAEIIAVIAKTKPARPIYVGLTGPFTKPSKKQPPRFRAGNYGVKQPGVGFPVGERETAPRKPANGGRTESTRTMPPREPSPVLQEGTPGQDRSKWSRFEGKNKNPLARKQNFVPSLDLPQKKNGEQLHAQP